MPCLERLGVADVSSTCRLGRIEALFDLALANDWIAMSEAYRCFPP